MITMTRFALAMAIAASGYARLAAATVDVAPGGDLQGAIDRAAPGDVIQLRAGGTYVGNFVLRNKPGASYITIRTSTADSGLPAGTRVGPGDAAKLAKVVSARGGIPVVRTEPYAHHWQLIGLEIAPQSPSIPAYVTVQFGSGSAGEQSTYAQIPHHLIVDRCWVHGWPNVNYKRGIALDSAHTDVLNSTVSDYHSDFQDSQAVGGYNGPGPFRIINNRLEGAGEVVMFGGASPTIWGLVPSNIEIRRNHLYKPMAWKPGQPGSTSYRPWIKNIFEIKNAQDVVLDGNLMENNWVQADQHGTAIVLTPRTEGGQNPWAVCQRVSFTNNHIRNVGGGVAILGKDFAPYPNDVASNAISFRNNVIEMRNDFSIDGSRVVAMTGCVGMSFDHNTILHDNYFIRGYGDLSPNLTYTNNITHFAYGLMSDRGYNQAALDNYFANHRFGNNVLIGGPSGAFRTTNFYPGNLAGVGFVNAGAGDYRLASTSPYKNRGSDGRDPGCDVDAMRAAMTGVTAPPPPPEPPQPPADTQSPFGGVARAIPGVIQAEDFDQGGEGVAFHDLDPANNGGGYRATAVDIRGCVDAGAGWQVGWMGPGEWLEYTVSIATAGSYDLGLRLASGNGTGGTVNLQLDGGALTGDIAFAATGGWDTWATVRKTVTLPSGTHLLHLRVVSGSLDLNHVSFAPASGGGIASGQLYKLVAKHSGKCLDVSGGSTADGANVHQWSDNGSTAQQWRVDALGDGTWSLTARCSGKALDVWGASSADGADIVQYSTHGGANQRWRIEATGGGWYRVVSVQSGKAMDVAGASGGDGADVIQWTVHDGDNQRWELVPVAPSGAG
ncbi:MAG TPA: RICIN domain-containing protein [Planctomycetota bacterium]|nr:RICIN domain-containing protein [Planctomycetota bacterium]